MYMQLNEIDLMLFLHHALYSCKSVRCSCPDDINTGGETDGLKYENMHVHTHISEWSMVTCQSTVTSEFQSPRLAISSVCVGSTKIWGKGLAVHHIILRRSLCSVTLGFKYTDRHCQDSGLQDIRTNTYYYDKPVAVRLL